MPINNFSILDSIFAYLNNHPQALFCVAIGSLVAFAWLLQDAPETITATSVETTVETIREMPQNMVTKEVLTQALGEIKSNFVENCKKLELKFETFAEEILKESTLEKFFKMFERITNLGWAGFGIAIIYIRVRLRFFKK